jgi:hypothetical protein
LVKKGSTVGDVYRKVMGDAPLAFVETVGGVRVSEGEEVAVGKNDVSFRLSASFGDALIRADRWLTCSSCRSYRSK